MNQQQGEGVSTNFLVICVCGKFCTSKAGLTLHQRSCKVAQEAKEKGLPMTRETEIITNENSYTEEVQKFLNLVKEMAVDANKAIAGNNKSAGRRARMALTNIKNMITPLRKNILENMQKNTTKEQTNQPANIKQDPSESSK